MIKVEFIVHMPDGFKIKYEKELKSGHDLDKLMEDTKKGIESLETMLRHHLTDHGTAIKTESKSGNQAIKIKPAKIPGAGI